MKFKGYLTNKAIITYIISFLIIILATVGLSYISSTKRFEEELTNTNIALLKQVNENIDMRLREIDRNTINFMEEPEIRFFMDNNYEESSEKYVKIYNLVKKINTLKHVNNNIDSIYLYSGVSQEVLTDSMSASLQDFNDKGWFKEYEELTEYYKWLSTRRVISSTAKYIPTEENVITLLRPYPKSNSIGFKKGAVIVNINETELNDIIRKARAKRVDTIFITDETGLIISHDDKNKIGTNVQAMEFGKEIIDTGKTEGRLESRIEGIENSIFHFTSPYTGWKYISVVSTIHANKPLIAMRNVLLSIAAIMFLLAIAATIVINQWAYRPIDQFLQSLSQKIRSYSIGEAVKDNGDNLEQIKRMFGSLINNHEAMQNQIKDSIPAVKWRIISDLLMGYAKDYDKVKAQFDHTGLTLNLKNYIVMIAEIDDRARVAKGSEGQDISLYGTALCQSAEELINQEGAGAAIVLSDSNVAVIMSFSDSEAHTNQIQALSMADLIRQSMNQLFGITVTIGIGNFYEGIKEINKSYNEAREALKYKAIIGKDSTISIEDVKLHDDREFYRMFSRINKISAAVKEADREEVSEYTSKMFEEAAAKNLSSDIIRQLCIQTILEVIRMALEIGVDSEIFESEFYYNSYEAMNQMETVAQMREYVSTSLEEIVKRIEEKRSSRGNTDLIEKIKAFIDANYMKYDLSLNYVAEVFGISWPYLSKIFKENIEKSFTDYLIFIRMEKAQRLLVETNIKINEICELIGYTSAHSFIRIFKKYAGKTPGEYRSENKLDQIPESEI
jgi:two-component system, response regulator YesN